MTWREFKDTAERNGVLDTDEVSYIDWPSLSDGMDVNRHFRPGSYRREYYDTGHGDEAERFVAVPANWHVAIT